MCTHKMVNLYIFCILARFSLFLGALLGTPRTQRAVTYASLLIGLGFFFVYLSGTRPTGAEVPGDGRIWWNTLRPLHGLLYLGYALGTFANVPCAPYLLLADVVAGIVAYVAHYGL